MKNPPCICDEVLAEARRRDDDTSWLEEEHRILYGHCASCHHRSPEPKGILAAGTVVTGPFGLPVPYDVAVDIASWADRDRMQRARDTAVANAALARSWDVRRQVNDSVWRSARPFVKLL